MGTKKLKRHIKLTGIKRRRLVMNEQKTSDLAIEAVRELLSKKPQGTGLLLSTTTSPFWVLLS